MTEKRLILNNIRSTSNVGSIFRTADAVGIDSVFLCGYTPDPIDRFGREVEAIKKTALGAEKSIGWEHFDKAVDLIGKLKKEGFQIISLEQSKDSVDYKNVADRLGDKVVIVLGNEVGGVDEEILEASDIVAEIPMKGQKESLNVSVSAGIFLYRLFD